MPLISEHLRPIYESTQNTLCDFLGSPALWSDQMIHKTLERTAGKPFNVEDVRMIVKDYLAVLCEFVRKGGSI